MDLMEYKAKELFVKYDLPTAVGVVADSADELVSKCSDSGIEYPVVVKAQVQTGGRGKAGGVQFAENEEQLKEVSRRIFGLDIKGHIVKRVMALHKVDITRELYLSIMLDRQTKCPIIIFSSVGGMDIEQTAKESPDAISKIVIDPIIGLRDYTARYLSVKAGFSEEQHKELVVLIRNLYKMFCEYNCMLCEINPLAITEEGKLWALDGKVSVDDSAMKKLPDIAEYYKEMDKHPLVKEAESSNFLYIPCDEAGDIAVMSNGSGMIMSCIDIITKNQMIVRASLDLGGGATSERIKEAVRLILSDEQTKYLFINIFGGITRCDEVALGIKLSVEEYGITKPVIVRFEGTNKDKGLELIKDLNSVTYVSGLLEGVSELMKQRKA